MMRVALDTNRYVDFCKGEPRAVQVIQEPEELILPFIVVAELRAGFLCGTQAQQNEQLLSRFLNSPRVTLLFPDEHTLQQYAFLFQQLRGAGTPIPTNDLWIAALVCQHHLVLFDRDKHFDALPQIPRIR